MFNPLNQRTVTTTLLGLSFLAITTISCSNQSGKDKHQSEGAKPSAINNKSAILAGTLDPVCEMEKDSTWKDYHVMDGDTVWFCSETCKTVFVGNPKRYIK